MPNFYISFATETEFLGATVVEAYHISFALIVANIKGLNPGGEAAILPMPAVMSPQDKAKMASYQNRLVPKAELLANGAKCVGDQPQYFQDRFKEFATIVCGDCNK